MTGLRRIAPRSFDVRTGRGLNSQGVETDRWEVLIGDEVIGEVWRQARPSWMAEGPTVQWFGMPPYLAREEVSFALMEGSRKAAVALVEMMHANRASNRRTPTFSLVCIERNRRERWLIGARDPSSGILDRYRSITVDADQRGQGFVAHGAHSDGTVFYASLIATREEALGIAVKASLEPSCERWKRAVDRGPWTPFNQKLSRLYGSLVPKGLEGPLGICLVAFANPDGSLDVCERDSYPIGRIEARDGRWVLLGTDGSVVETGGGAEEILDRFHYRPRIVRLADEGPDEEQAPAPAAP
jgi:hypothetical protein